MDTVKTSEKLGLLLTTTPENENTHTVVKLAEAALLAGKEVHIFLMCDGVHNANDKRVLALIEKGVKVAVCAHNAKERHVAERDQILWGSLYDFACIAEECDRLLAFN